MSAVPSATYKVKTEWLKDGCVCLNVAADKNFETNVREKARIKLLNGLTAAQTTGSGIVIYPSRREGHYFDAFAQLVRFDYLDKSAYMPREDSTGYAFNDIHKLCQHHCNRANVLFEYILRAP